MSIRAVIRAAMAAVSRLVLVPVEIMIGGVRTVVSMLLPRPPSAMTDAAEDVLCEDAEDAAPPTGASLDDLRKRMARPSEPERIRRAARLVEHRRPVPASLLDPADDDEREVLDWLVKLDSLQAGTVAKASDDAIMAHICGQGGLRAPMLPRHEARAEAERELRRPLTYQGWVGVLLGAAHEIGDDDPDIDQLLDAAHDLAEARTTLDEWRSLRPRSTGAAAA